MAEKRMYSKKITETDDFLALPLSTQALYFHLGMNADDDGFVSSPLKVMRMIGANKNEYDLLLIKRYLIPFENGVCVIKDWRINNYLRSDRYTPTIYTTEKSQLTILENGSYEVTENVGIPLVSTDKNRIEENSIDKIKLNTMEVVDNISFDDFKDKNPTWLSKYTEDEEDLFEFILGQWNEYKIIQHKMSEDIKKTIKNTLKIHAEEKIVLAMERYALAYHDKRYKLCEYKWNLIDFLKQKNALPDFIDGGSKWENYKTFKEKSK